MAIGLAMTALGACQAKVSPPSTAPAPAPPTSSATTATTTTTTAPYVPSSPQPVAEYAANLLIQAWSEADRTKAAPVAAPGAVTALFAVPYPGGGPENRGCSQQISPVTCTYRVGTSIIEMSITQIRAGWYVSSVTDES